ncbi:MAG: SBBP repeat-containing protein [Planctomycetales bacterium]|nr:SBBP repeat-containing protein [Planctomycetales bacterium]
MLEARRPLAVDFGLAVDFPVGTAFGVGGESIAADLSGNIYLTGNFSDTVQLDPDGVAEPLVSAGQTDVFLAKYDRDGEFLWAKQLGGSGFDYVRDMAVDASGNIHLVGNFSGTADFDPSAETNQLTSAGDFDAFVVRLTADGELTWAKALAGTGFEVAQSLAVDANGAAYVLGAYFTTIDLNPSASQSFSRTTAGDSDIFLTKLDVNGNFVWGASMGGSGADFAAAVTLDASNNVLVVGDFVGTADFDPSTATSNLTSGGNRDLFIAKLTTGGTFTWARRVGAGESELGTGIATDASGNVYAVGSFRGTVDFNPGAATVDLTSRDDSQFGSDVFVLKLSASGDYVWARTLGTNSPIEESARDVTVSRSGDVYVTGALAGANRDVFLARLNSAGSTVWQQNLVGDGTNTVESLALDHFGRILLTGQYTGTTDFDPTAESFSLTSASDTAPSAFVVQLSQPLIGNRVWLDLNENGILDAGENGLPNVTVQLFNPVDGIIGNGNDTLVGTRTTDANGAYLFEDAALGSYYVQVTLPDNFKFAPQDQGTDDAIDSDVDATSGRTAIFALAADTAFGDVDAGLALVNPRPWQNPVNHLNVDNDTGNNVSPIDVLLVINQLNSPGARLLPLPDANFAPPPYLDVNGDQFVSPIDALLVINHLNNVGAGEAEAGEVASQVSLAAGLADHVAGAQVTGGNFAARSSSTIDDASPEPRLAALAPSIAGRETPVVATSHLVSASQPSDLAKPLAANTDEALPCGDPARLDESLLDQLAADSARVTTG